MNPQIDPLILEKLQAFSQRRRQLIIRRGIYSAVATLLIGMMIVALVDALVQLPDAVRWGLSGAAYLAVIIVEWRTCLRLLVTAPGPRQLARLVEHAEPKLREDLLSAVELGESKPDAVFDSEQFRSLVQSDVAARMEKLDVQRLLPAQLLRRYAFLAAGFGIICVTTIALTGFQFGTALIRALLPTANIARISRVKIQIVEPTPAEMRVPQGDTLPLVIELTGQKANKAFLETSTANGGREVVQMTPLGHDRFSSTIQVGRENVRYRARAGDGETIWYKLEAVARPAVVQFQKSYVYPAYSKLEPKVVTEENGDLAALEGSEVELKLQTNQKVKEAELRIEQGKKNTVVPLVAKDGALVAMVPLRTSGIYRVHLVGAETGFENKFSPEYELRADPDLVPQIDLELPKQDLILPSNEIVEVQGTASDDFALAKVSQLVRINEGPWKETPLPTEEGVKSKVERRWDLFEQGVKPGDLITTKLVATDLKGNKAESPPLQVTITAAGFESKRLQALAGQLRLQEAFKSQQSLSSALVKQVQEARQQFERLAEGDPQRAQVLLPLNAAQEQFVQKNGETMKLFREVMTETIPGHQTGDLALLGNALVRSQAVFTQNAQRLCAAVAANPTMPTAREHLAEAHDLTNRTEQKARQVMDVHRVFLAAEELDIFSENIYVVAQEHSRLVTLAHRSGTDVEKWTPVANRLRVVLAELRGLEELLGATVEQSVHGVSDPLRNVQKVLNKRRTDLEKVLAANPGVELLSPTLELSKAIGETSRTVNDIRRGFRGPPLDRLRELARDTETVYMNFEFLRQETERIYRNDRIPVEIGDDLLEGRWQNRLGVFKGMGDVEEWRPDADSYFVNDLRLTTRVLEALHGNNPGKPGKDFPKELQAIDRSFRVLECGHDIAAVVEGYRRLAMSERWEIYNPKSRTTNVRDWSWFGERLRSLPDETVRSLNFEERRKLAQDVQKILREGPQQPFAQALNREMEDRFNLTRDPVSVRNEAGALADYLQQALDLLRQPMEEARKDLAKLTPSLADAMKQLAKKAEELKGQTTNQAQQAHEKLPEEAKADARQALAQQQQLNEKIEALKDAIRADANQQNIMQAEGRERARDADDALAMLKEPPVRAEEDLALAAKTDKAAMQEQALSQAAEQQDKLAKALDKMSDHYAALEQGKAEETRMALRETEKENGIKEQLDQQFAKAEEMSKLAQATPEDLLKQLEKALPQNPQMQQELSAISQNVLKSASEQLKKASAQENDVAQNVQKLAAQEKAQAANSPTPPNNPSQNPQDTPNAQSPNMAAAQAQGQPNQPNQPQSPQPNAQANTPQPNPQGQPAPNTPNGQPQNPQQMTAQAQTPEQGQPNPNNPAAAQNSPQGQQPEAPKANPMLAQGAQQQKPIGEAAAQAASDISRAGRHEERMQNKLAGEQLQQLGKGLQQTAEQQVPNAQQALQQAQQAAQAQGAVDAANGELQKALNKLAAVANPGEQPASEPASSAATQAPQAPADAQAQAQMQTQAQAQGQGAMPPGSKPSASAQAAATSSQPAQKGESAQATQAAGAQGSPQGANAQVQNNAAKGTPAGSPASPSPGSPAGQPPGATPPTPADAMAAAPASPQEQVWMARALDALDAALNGTAPSQSQTAQSAQAQAGQPPSGQQQKAQASGNTSQAQQTSAAQAAGNQAAPQSNSMSQAQSALAQAAQAAAAQARSERTAESGQPGQPGQPQPGSLQAISKGGAQSPNGNGPRGTLGDAKNKPGDWGKLPKQMAEQLTQGQREGIAGEYRNQVETYYRAIAEKSKKQ